MRDRGSSQHRSVEAVIQSEKVSLGELTPPRMKAEACCGLRGRYLGRKEAFERGNGRRAGQGMQRAQGEEVGKYPWVGRAGASREHIDRVLWQCCSTSDGLHHGSKRERSFASLAQMINKRFV